MLKTIKNLSGLPSIASRAYTQSSLLIPDYLLVYFNQRVTIFGSRRRYFAHLLSHYGINLSQYYICPKVDKWKKQYQEEGLNLTKKNFIPDPEHWEEFRNIASTYGLTMCNFFVVLLELERQRWMNAGCPENFKDDPLFIWNSQKRWNSNIQIQENSQFSLNNLSKIPKLTRMQRIIDYERHILIRNCYIQNQE